MVIVFIRLLHCGILDHCKCFPHKCLIFQSKFPATEDLCDCEFSLAYGNKILLNQTKLRLKRGQRYGLCGGNDCGKSTLMRSIANGQVEGFPPQDVLTSVYLESDIPAELADFSVLEFVRLKQCRAFYSEAISIRESDKGGGYFGPPFYAAVEKI